MDTSDLIQGSQAWLDARVGSIGGSRIAAVFSQPRAGSSASRVREALLADLLAEKITGREAVRAFVGDPAAIEWGKQTEPFARAAYEEKTGRKVELAGLIRHPLVPHSHASPDGLVADDGMVEIKCPKTTTHQETCRLRRATKAYIAQMKWGLACTGRRWCDFISFDPRAEDEPLFVLRVEPDPAELRAMEMGVFGFIMELEARLAAHQFEESKRCQSQEA